MTRKSPPRMTKAEAAYVRDMARKSAFEKIDRGEARTLSSAEFPDPIKRFLQRERSVVHVKLSSSAKRRLKALSRASGVSVEELARRWVEQGLAREAG